MNPTAPSPFLYPDSSPSPDRGNSTAATIAWIFVFAFVGAILLINQLGGKPDPKPESTTAHISPPDASDQFAIVAKLLYKFLRVPGASSPQSISFSLGDLSKSATRPVDQFRLAILESEWSGPDPALARLHAILNPKEAGLEDDIRTLSLILNDRRDAIDSDQLDAFKANHGWFARLALSRGLADSDPSRAALLSGGGALLALIVIGSIVFAVLFFGGIACFGIAAYRIFARGMPSALAPPAPGGSVYLETVAVFAGVFLAFKLIAPPLLLGMVAADRVNSVMLVLQWLLVPTALWAACRGVPFRTLARNLGWTRGKGVLREVGAGLFAYLASFPLLLLALGFSIGVVKIREGIARAQGITPEPPKNHIMDFLTGGSTIQLALLFVLATLWAPIVEEAIFRGAFYRHLRSRMSIVAAAAISAVFFGILHPNDIFLLLPVITLGFTFALMREWRSSLIASMTAHCLNNAMVLTLLISLLSIVGDS